MPPSRLLPALPPGRRTPSDRDVQPAPTAAIEAAAADRRIVPVVEAAFALRRGFVAQQEPSPSPPPSPPGATIDPAFGAERADTLDDFTALAVRDDVPGAPRVRTVKFLMSGVDGDAPRLYLMQTHRFEYHYDFATEALAVGLPLEAFNAATYFRDQRRFLAGTILHHESYTAADGTVGLFAIEFWPTDPVNVRHLDLAFHAIVAALPFAAGRLAYHPAGATQDTRYHDDAAALAAAGVRAISSDELFAGVTYTPMNLGVGYGVLRIVAAGAAGAARPPTVRDVVVFEQTPNDLSHVAGIVTAAPQTPLSHINLKAKQNGTPNCYLAGAATAPELIALRDRVVRFEVAADRLTVTAATADEATAFLDALRPKVPQVPPRDLTRTTAAALTELRFGDAATFGAKATNVAELGRILPRAMVPDGFVLPFAFYDRFMRDLGLYAAARELMNEPGFTADAAVRDEALARLRKKIKKATMPAALAGAIAEVQARLIATYGSTQPFRCRSSTNNEDLPGYNGAGLYDSYTHRPDEGHLASTVQQVFASLWNFRAFEERDFHRIDHFVAAMGVLLHPNEDDEQANGVAYTRNIYDPSWPGFYVNAQLGESLVTNPDPGARPEELLISRIGEHGEYETQYISRSSLVPAGRAILGEPDLERLVAAMERIQPHFARRYGRPDDPTFAMDIEWKIRKDGSLQVKQARPTVD